VDDFHLHVGLANVSVDSSATVTGSSPAPGCKCTRQSAEEWQPKTNKTQLEIVTNFTVSLKKGNEVRGPFLGQTS